SCYSTTYLAGCCISKWRKRYTRVICSAAFRASFRCQFNRNHPYGCNPAVITGTLIRIDTYAEETAQRITHHVDCPGHLCLVGFRPWYFLPALPEEFRRSKPGRRTCFLSQQWAIEQEQQSGNR